MSDKYQKAEIKSGRVGGLLYQKEDSNKPVLVLFNQWRSGAHSILSKYIAELVFEKEEYSAVLFIDRIASGGASDNKLSPEERSRMRHEGEFLFGAAYVNAIEKIIEKHSLPERYVLGGSSAGAPAVLAAAQEMSPKQRNHVAALVLVEPSGMMTNGFGKKRVAAVPLAFMKHLVAYRHRVQRGWWTPMDKEQYFAKGTMFEYRANWWAQDYVYQALCDILPNPDYPRVWLVLSKTSHIHSRDIREALKRHLVKPHAIKEIAGNHDKICQPPSLSEIYSEVLSGSRKLAE